MAEPLTDFGTLQRFGTTHGLDFAAGEWWGYHTLTLEKGNLGVSVHSDDCKVTFHFDAEGAFVDVLVTCETCQHTRDDAP